MLICPKCGRSSENVKFIEAFCIDCYPYNLKLPEKRIEIEVCKRCGRMRLKGEWVPYDERRISKYVAKKCKGDFSYADYDREDQMVTFTIRKDQTEVRIKRELPIRIINVICPDCSKIAGGYYESIIQLRGNEKLVRKYTKILTKMLSRKTFISKVDEKKEGGVDIYVGNTRVVLETMAELRLKRKITRKLVGTKGGKRFYRTTFLVRFE